MSVVVVARDKEHIAEVTINRPEALNALSSAVLNQLQKVFTDLSQDTTIRAIILTGAGGKAFVAGADIGEMIEMDRAKVEAYAKLGHTVMNLISNTPVPVIAKVNGYALGGGLELALACDLIFASTKAKLGQPEVNLGIIPGFGGTQRLTQRAGVGTARRLIYSGEIISADEGYNLGIVDQIFSQEQLDEKTLEYAAIVIKKGPAAVRVAKQAIHVYDQALTVMGLEQEQKMFIDLFCTNDRIEGMRAFLEKRAAIFRDD